MQSLRGERFLKVYEFMTRDLGLQGVQLLLYARIFGFSDSDDGEGSFYESRRSTADYLGVTERAVTKCLKALVEKGLVLECGRHRLPSGRSTKRYVANMAALVNAGILDDSPIGERCSPVANTTTTEQNSPTNRSTTEQDSSRGMNGVRPSIKGKRKEIEEERRRRYAEYDE